MTQEEKAKAYDDALKKAGERYNEEYTSTLERSTLAYVFPELKESEDEEIRKALLEMVHDTTGDELWVDYNVHKEDAIAWLEKQGEKKLLNNEQYQTIPVETLDRLYAAEKELAQLKQKVEPKFKIGDTVWLKTNTHEYTKTIDDMDDECYIFNDGRILTFNCQDDWELVEQKPAFEMKTPEESLGIDSDTYNKIVDDCVYGEQKPVKFKPSFRVGDVIKPKDPVLGEPRIVKGIHPKFGYDTNNGILDFEFEDNWELVEQKPADKAEPKFHEGEWLCENKPTNYAHFIQILEIVNVQGKDRYRISRDLHNDEDVVEFGFIEKYYHKFDIQDAKDGDVLINWNNTTFIFKAIEDETVKFHIAYNEKWDAIKTPSTKSSHMGLPEPQFEFHPATKEQRDTLMKAMTDAGYEFDFENKELKKIERKPVVSLDENGEPILTPFEAELFSMMSDAWQNYSLGEEVNIAKIVKEHSEELLERANEQKPAEWSEEDVAILDSAIAFVEHSAFTTVGKGKGCVVAWLKSIKDRYTWKPSDEQMKQLKKYCPDNRPLTSLYEQLKKLKE